MADQHIIRSGPGVQKCGTRDLFMGSLLLCILNMDCCLLYWGMDDSAEQIITPFIYCYSEAGTP